MDKRTFIEQLTRMTGTLTQAERDKLAQYYSEMIDDRMEEGVSEEEAVASLGDPADLARELALAPAGGEGASQSVEALANLRLRLRDADVTVAQAPLENGAAAQLRFSNPEKCTWRMDGDTLEIVQNEAEAPRLSLRWVLHTLGNPAERVTVMLADTLPGDADLHSAAGNVTLDGVVLGGTAKLDSDSGDISLSDCRVSALTVNSRSGDADLKGVTVAGAAQLKAQSGDINATRLSVDGELRAETASGDIELRELRCQALTASSASGDIEVDRGSAGEAAVHTASGDVRLDELETDPALRVETASGDIDLTRCIARQTRLRTASGDVNLRVEPLPCGYDVNAVSRAGDISIDTGDASDDPGVLKPRIDIQTVSGDIRVTELR